MVELYSWEPTLIQRQFADSVDKFRKLFATILYFNIILSNIFQRKLLDMHIPVIQ